jgi:hypothetical protein
VALSRRTALAQAVAVVLVAAGAGGCTPASGASPTQSPTQTPPPDKPVVSWTVTGGFTIAGVAALRPPRLVVYSDGETIADAAYRTRLQPDDLQSLLDHLAADLRAPSASPTTSIGPSIVDAPTTVLSAWDGNAIRTISVYGLDELRDEKVYGSAWYDARDRLGQLYKTVTATAQPYLGVKVRVVTEPVAPGTKATSPLPWPAQVALPTAPEPSNHELTREDLEGQAARDAVRLLTRDLDQRGAWPTYKTADGQLVQASWRYLLPSE